MALALDLPPTWFLDRFQKPILTLRPLHYSATLSKPEQVSLISQFRSFSLCFESHRQTCDPVDAAATH